MEPQPNTTNPDKSKKWIQLTQNGTFRGHPQGAFTINPSVNETLRSNFYRTGIPIPIDAEHASEICPSEGRISAVGAPAMGFIHALENRGADGLWGLAEWLEPARTYIKEGRYRYISPAIRWKSKDRITGEDIGPRLSSVAITNQPFLPDMSVITARAGGEESVHVLSLTGGDMQDDPQTLSAKYSCHSVLGMLPRLKQTFGLHELATVEHVQTALENYRSHLDAINGDGLGTHEGVGLEPYSLAMREMVNAHAGMDWYAILDIIDELIDAYLDQHGLPDFEESHGPIPGGSSENSAVATAASTEGVPMPESTEGQAAAAVPPVPAPVPATPAAPDAAVAPATTTAASADGALPSPDVARLTLENAELKAKLTSFEVKLLALSAAQNESHESALTTEVDAALVTYGQAKGLDDSMRPHLLSMLKSAPDAFHAMYPPVAPEQRHLLSNLTGGGASDPQHPGARVEADTAPEIQDPSAEPTVTQPGQVTMLSYGELVESLKRDQKLTHSAAMVRAEQLTKARAAH